MKLVDLLEDHDDVKDCIPMRRSRRDEESNHEGLLSFSGLSRALLI